jgi:hypothetical protein
MMAHREWVHQQQFHMNGALYAEFGKAYQNNSSTQDMLQLAQVD